MGGGCGRSGMIAIPDQMKHLPRDERGYPIPYIVFRDSDRKPHFTINDQSRVQKCKTADICSICGKGLFRGRWFVGGPGSALHPNGAYIDPPLHHECMQFALQTCPYLLSEKYTKRIDGKTLDPAKAPGVIGLLDETMDPTRPQIFVAVMAIGQSYTDRGYIVPIRPYRKMEFWRNGVLERSFEDAELIERAFRIHNRNILQEN
jgi:hypothetical protein